MQSHPPGPDGLSYMRSAEHLRDFVDTAAIGLHWVGSDGTILWANAADYEPLGYSASEYIGHNIGEFHADPDTIADILRRLAAGERLHDYEARLRCKDGSLRDVMIRSSVLFEDGPQGRRFVHTRCYTQDVTERKRLEKARDRFVAVLGHDLRNPLSSISVGAETLLRADDIAPKYKTTLQRIVNSTDRMTELIADLIDFARTLGGQLPLSRRPLDMATVCRTIIDELQTESGPRVDLQSTGDTRGEWDSGRLGQAISNLLGNALKHGKPPIRLALRGNANHVVLEITNQGRPIPEESLCSVFEPFSHAADTRGLGLGLFIVKEIVTAHGGTIDVVSTAETGTTFTVHWPRTFRLEDSE